MPFFWFHFFLVSIVFQSKVWYPTENKFRKRNDKVIFECKKKKITIVFFHQNKKPLLRLKKMCKAVIAHRKPKNVSHARHAHYKFQPKWIGTHIATCNGTSQFASCGRTSATHDLQCTWVQSVCKYFFSYFRIFLFHY